MSIAPKSMSMASSSAQRAYCGLTTSVNFFNTRHVNCFMYCYFAVIDDILEMPILPLVYNRTIINFLHCLK